MRKFISYPYLTAIAILFHIIGLAGIGLLHSDSIIATTPLHLILMFVLLLLSYIKEANRFALWWILAYGIGFAAEWIGVHTGWLFGQYHYTDVLGWQIDNIPLLIGCNWIVVMTGTISLTLSVSRNNWLTTILAATIATVYDWVLEPVAMKLDFWQWDNGVIPMYNYLCWWIVSFILAWFWIVLKVRPNKFGSTLFFIQLLFFLILRILL